MMQFESRRPEPAPPSGKCGKCGQSKPRTRNQETDRRRIAHRFPRLKRTDREKTQGSGRPRKAEVWEGCGLSLPRTRGPETAQERIAHRLSTPVRAPNPRATETPGNRKTRRRKTAVETPATTQYPQPRIEQADRPQTVQYVLNPITIWTVCSRPSIIRKHCFRQHCDAAHGQQAQLHHHYRQTRGSSGVGMPSFGTFLFIAVPASRSLPVRPPEQTCDQRSGKLHSAQRLPDARHRQNPCCFPHAPELQSKVWISNRCSG